MGKFLIPYLANAGGDLTNLEEDIRNAVQDVEEFYGDRLKQPIDVIFTCAQPEIIIPEDKIGGRAHASNFVVIGLPQNGTPSRQTIGEMLCHEIGHAFRWQHNPEQADSFMRTAVLEGISICLEEEFAKRFKTKTFFLETIQNRYANGVTCASIIKRTKPIWGAAHYDYDMLFYNGNNKLPRWTGYTLGYMIATHVLSRSDQDIFELATKRYSYIEYYFNKMLPR